MNEDKFG